MIDRDLHDQVLTFIADEGSGDFNDLAVAIFAYQFREIEAYRNVCQRLGKTPESVALAAPSAMRESK